jgi:hypothetical protein
MLSSSCRKTARSIITSEFDDPDALKLRSGRSVFYQPDSENLNGYLLPSHLDTHSSSAQKIPSTSHAWGVQHAAWNGGRTGTDDRTVCTADLCSATTLRRTAISGRLTPNGSNKPALPAFPLHDRLPAVSWFCPTWFQSEHPAFMPADGATFVAGKIDAIAANPPVWAKTVFILNYDENDLRAGRPTSLSTVFRWWRVPVPLHRYFAMDHPEDGSASEPFDHTSVLQSLEKFTDVCKSFATRQGYAPGAASLTRAARRSSDRFETLFGQAGSQPESPQSPGSPLILSKPADRSVSFRRETIPPVLTPPGLLAR